MLSEMKQCWGSNPQQLDDVLFLPYTVDQSAFHHNLWMLFIHQQKNKMNKKEKKHDRVKEIKRKGTNFTHSSYDNIITKE